MSQLIKVRSPKWPHTVSKFVENADLVSVPLAQVVESVVEVVETRPGVRSYAYAMVERMVECPPPNPHTLSITQLHHQPLNPSPPLTPPIRRSMVKTATSPLRRLSKQDKGVKTSGPREQPVAHLPPATHSSQEAGGSPQSTSNRKASINLLDWHAECGEHSEVTEMTH